mmetsp:Transcript_99925/g.278273  ORF Transcript_99925/g.278273 Transcript_99925/m.278273 type:complete len:227 (+) Transcript_99925:253-933(+)
MATHPDRPGALTAMGLVLALLVLSGEEEALQPGANAAHGVLVAVTAIVRGRRCGHRRARLLLRPWKPWVRRRSVAVRSISMHFGRWHPDVTDREVIELDGVRASLLVIGGARSHAIGPLAIHPQHVVAAPIAEDGRHAGRKGLRELAHARIAANARVELAGLALLGELYIHRGHVPLHVHWEGYSHLEGFRGVDTRTPWPILLRGEVARSVERVTTSVAAALAIVV